MFLTQVFVFILLGIVFSCLCAVPTAPKCRRQDSDCLKQSAQSLLPLLAQGKVSSQLKPLDTLRIYSVEHISPALRFSSHDFTVRGLKDCTFDNITNNVGKSILNVDALCTLVGESEYDIKGKVQNLQLDAQGHLAVSFKNILIQIKLYIEDKTEEGKIHWHLRSWDSSYVVKNKSKIDLSNLFKGTVKPSEEVRSDLGATLTALISELEPPIINAIVNEVMENIKIYFNLIPVEDIVIE